MQMQFKVVDIFLLIISVITIDKFLETVLNDEWNHSTNDKWLKFIHLLVVQRSKNAIHWSNHMIFLLVLYVAAIIIID